MQNPFISNDTSATQVADKSCPLISKYRIGNLL
jgi:hypothetical protein